MNNKKFIEELKRYEDSLKGILSRFNRSRDGIDINIKDDPIYRQQIIEITDLINDHLPNSHYSQNIVNQFNEGTSNFLGSPSYKSVETIMGIISALITRLERNPEIIDSPQKKNEIDNKMESNLEVPEKVTIPWIIKNISVSLIWQAFLIILFFFLAGVYSSQIKSIAEVLEKLPGVTFRYSIPAETATNIQSDINKLIEGHNSRLEILQKSLMEQVDKSTDYNKIFSEREAHSIAANSIRTQIKEENKDFEKKLESIKKLLQ